MPKFSSPLEYAFSREAATSIGLAGKNLRKALDALRTYEEKAALKPESARPHKHAELIAIAGEAYWSFVVQRESLGLMDSDYIASEYAVPPRVLRSAAPRRDPPDENSR